MTDRLSTLRDLRERVRSSSNPNRELRAAVFAAVCPAPAGVWYEADGEGVSVYKRSTRVDKFPPPPILSSIDDAAALIGRCLPDWWWSCGVCRRENHASVGPEDGTEWAGKIDALDGFGANAPLALVDALLSALIAQEGRAK